LLKQALRLNPNYADAYALLAANHISQGKPEQTLDTMTRAYQLNPTGGYLYDIQLARAHYFLNNYEQALAYLNAAFERNPTFIDLQMYMAATYIQLGRYDDAAWMLLEAKQTNPDFDPHAWAMAYPYLDNKGYRAKLLKDIEQAEAYSR
jgi:tetratricopeptide (TPR) repeat protein